MSAMAYQITSVSIIYSTVFFRCRSTKQQSSASPVNFPHTKGQYWGNVSIWWRHHAISIWFRKCAIVETEKLALLIKFDSLAAPDVVLMTIPMQCSHWSWWRHQMEPFPRYWPFVWGIHRSPVDSSHKGQWRGTLMFALICASANGWANNRFETPSRLLWRHCNVKILSARQTFCFRGVVNIGFISDFRGKCSNA